MLFIKNGWAEGSKYLSIGIVKYIIYICVSCNFHQNIWFNITNKLRKKILIVIVIIFKLDTDYFGSNFEIKLFNYMS